jgi:hypothetical protein
MNKFITTNNGGIPVVLDDLRWLLGQATSGNAGIYQLLTDMLLPYGTDFVISGCVATGTPYPTALSEGWIMLNSEILKVDAQVIAYPNYFYIKSSAYDSSGAKTTESGTTINTYFKPRALANRSIGTLTAAGSVSPLGFVGATNAEALAMALTSKGITPANMVYLRATIPEVAALTVNNKYITPYSATALTGGLIASPIINIGVWDMDSTNSITVAHGLSVAAIRFVSVTIIPDVGNYGVPLNSVGVNGELGGGLIWDTTNITLVRVIGGFFDNVSYDSVAMNRGYIKIEFVP